MGEDHGDRGAGGPQVTVLNQPVKELTLGRQHLCEELGGREGAM